MLGALVHEGTHYFFGWIFGASPTISRYQFGLLPTQVDFDSPDNLGNWETRITGGSVFLFIPLALAGAMIHWWPLLAFGIGGIGISWTDLLAGFHPREWRKFTAGEEISRDDFGWNRDQK